MTYNLEWRELFVWPRIDTHTDQTFISFIRFKENIRSISTGFHESFMSIKYADMTLY
jgi:hypothetical protein